MVHSGDLAEIGQPLANIINPYDGEMLETLYAPVRAKVFFMHADPLTYAATAVFKLIKE